MAGSLRSAQAGADWQATAQGMTRAFLTLLQSHPNAIPLFASRSAIAPGSLVMVDGAVGVLIQAGFTPDESIKIFQTLFALTIGHAMFHYGRRAEDSYARAEEYAKYPHLSQVGSPTLRDPEAEFEYGLAAVLEGLRQQLERNEKTNRNIKSRRLEGL